MPTPTPNKPKFVRPTPAPNRQNFDENVISTPMYNTEEPESRGPYYVPWKKTSMDFYNKIKESEDDSHYANTRYKSLDGYITGIRLEICKRRRI